MCYPSARASFSASSRTHGIGDLPICGGSLVSRQLNILDTIRATSKGVAAWLKELRALDLGAENEEGELAAQRVSGHSLVRHIKVCRTRGCGKHQTLKDRRKSRIQGAVAGKSEMLVNLAQ